MKTASFIGLCSVVGLLAGEPPAGVTVTKENAFTFFRDYKRLTKEPWRNPLVYTVDCVPETVKNYTHATTGIHVYVNPLADDTIAQKRKVFPAGAVIVKEKLGTNGVVIGVGGMVKRAAGFDPKNGDWEYFYSDKDYGFTVGRLQKCADCHAGAKETDYVISVWKPFK
jgi:hypothetical protein